MATAEEKGNYTQFAVVRNPLDHLLDAYKQIGRCLPYLYLK